MTVDVRNIGLRGVTVADTAISKVDGQAGKLIYRGYSIEDLANQTTFEEVVFLLLMGRLPSESELEATRRSLAEARELPPRVIDALRARTPSARPMDVLQGAIAVLADHDDLAAAEERGDVVRAGIKLIARTMAVAAAWHHLRRGDTPPPMDGDLSHAGAFLQGLWGRRPTSSEVQLMDTLLIIHAEHTLNASTFACREVASTRATLYASVAAAVGALSGPLHGGANARVMEMLMSIGFLDAVTPWVKDRVATGQRVMGLGHAVYKTKDPRAVILQAVAEEVLEGHENETWYRLCLEVERVAREELVSQKGLELYPNVDFYSGPILYTLGLELDMFPVFFGVSRVAGWVAHYLEEYFAEAAPKPALYRPKAHYVGRWCGPQGCKHIPMASRGAGCPAGVEFDGCAEALAAEDPLFQAPPEG